MQGTPALALREAGRSPGPAGRSLGCGSVRSSTCGHHSLPPFPASSGSALPSHCPHSSAQQLNLAVLMPLLVCSPSPSRFLKPTPFPTGCQAAGRKSGRGPCCATARLAQHIALGSAIKAPAKDETAVEQHFPEILPRRDSPGRTAGAGQAVM